MTHVAGRVAVSLIDELVTNFLESCAISLTMQIMFAETEIKLTNLGQLIASCWEDAETATASGVATKYLGPSEEQITFLFASELRASVSSASKSGSIERAFLADLRNALPNLDDPTARRFRGLVARVNFHNRSHEGKRSASDLGIVIRRPVVSTDSGITTIYIRIDQAIGLLAQAKLGKRTSSRYSWGGFTRTQQRLFPQLRDFYSVLLYRLGGALENELGRFGWQLCKGFTWSKIKAWFVSDSFPLEMTSATVLQRLVARKIGTEDQEVLRTIIDPEAQGQQTIEIQVFWPGDAPPPPPAVRICQSTRQVQQVQQRCR